MELVVDWMSSEMLGLDIGAKASGSDSATVLVYFYHYVTSADQIAAFSVALWS